MGEARRCREYRERNGIVLNEKPPKTPKHEKRGEQRVSVNAGHKGQAPYRKHRH